MKTASETIDMGTISSLYPGVHELPSTNLFNICFNHPDAEAYKDYTMFIDGLSGRTTQYYELKHLIESTTSALAASTTEGGLGLHRQTGHMVGILSQNSVVSFVPSMS